MSKDTNFKKMYHNYVIFVSEIDLITYYSNGPSYYKWDTIFSDPDVSYNIEELVTGWLYKL